MKFIDLIQTNTDEEQPRQSSLMLEGKRQGEGAEVIGVLDHCTEFKPRRAIDRDLMVAWLDSLEYQGEAKPRPGMMGMVKVIDGTPLAELKIARRDALAMGKDFRTPIALRPIYKDLALVLYREIKRY